MGWYVNEDLAESQSVTVRWPGVRQEACCKSETVGSFLQFRDARFLHTFPRSNLCLQKVDIKLSKHLSLQKNSRQTLDVDWLSLADAFLVFRDALFLCTFSRCNLCLQKFKSSDINFILFLRDVPFLPHTPCICHKCANCMNYCAVVYAGWGQL